MKLWHKTGEIIAMEFYDEEINMGIDTLERLISAMEEGEDREYLRYLTDIIIAKERKKYSS